MRPIFILGCPRSGTTLLGAMLGAAEGVIALQESHFKFRGPTDVTREAQASMMAKTDLRIWDIEDAFPPISRPLSQRDFYLAAIDAYAGKFAPGKRVDAVVDHTPDNARSAAMLARAFPESRFIHIVRDGRAVFNSVRSLDWGPSTPVRAAHWWSEWIAPALALQLALPAERVLKVDFRTLVASPDEELQRICAFADLAYHPSMKGGRGLILSQYTKKNHMLVQSLPQIDRIDAWQRDLRSEDIAAFNWAAESLLELLGFDPRFECRPERPPFARRLRWELCEVGGHVRDRWRYRRRRRKMAEPLLRG